MVPYEHFLYLSVLFFLQSKSTFMIPSKETVELLAQNSGGDIRTAINGLQFSCLKGEFERMKNILAMFKLLRQFFLNCLNFPEILKIASPPLLCK